MSIDFDPALVRENPVIYHRHASVLLGAAEHASKISVGRYLQGSYSKFDERIEAILPHTWLNSRPQAGAHTQEEEERDNGYSEKIVPRPWTFRHKKRWVLDGAQFPAGSLDGIPGDLIQTSLTTRQVALRKKILLTTRTNKTINELYSRWLAYQEEDIFHNVRKELNASFISFHPADCLTYIYRNERDRKVIEGAEFFFIKDLYMTELNAINRWYFYGKTAPMLTGRSEEDRRLTQQILRGNATWKYLVLTRREKLPAEPFVILQLGKYRFPERSIGLGSEITTITDWVQLYLRREISKNEFVQGVDLHCLLLSKDEAPFSAADLLARIRS